MRCFSMLVLVLAIAAPAVGCAGQAKQQAAAGYDFSAAKSYAWVTEEPVLIQLGDPQPRVRTKENEQRVRAAIDAALAARGLTKVAREEAELEVAFSVGTVVRYRLEGGHDSWIAGLEPGQPQTKGTLHIYLLDRSDKKEVWHGWTSKWLNRSEDPDAIVQSAVAKIMAQYPVRAR